VNRIISRILLATLILPGALLLNLIVYQTLDRKFSSYPQSTWISDLSAGALALLAWVMLWRRDVRWSRRRRNVFAIALFAAIVGGVASGIYTGKLFDAEVGIFVGVYSAVLLAMLASIFAWRESACERTARFAATPAAVVCPACRFDMSAQRASICPRCGHRCTIDEILAAQATPPQPLQHV
jgi:peptidoglycan/LPS O-acetylase OafA/YrhL